MSNSVKLFLIKVSSAALGVFSIYAIGTVIGKIQFDPIKIIDKIEYLTDNNVFDDRFDQYVYLISLALIPVLILLVSYILNKYAFEGNSKYAYFVIGISSSLIAALIFVILWNDSLISQIIFTKYFYLYAIFGIVSYIVFKTYNSSNTPKIFSFLLIFIIAATSDYRNFPPHWFHFEPVIYNMAQLRSGHATLIGGLTSQYGLYNSFILPIFKDSYGVAEYTRIMAILFFITILIPVYIFFSIFKNKWIAFAGSVIFIESLGVILYRNLRIIGEGIVIGSSLYSDPYYQYTPIRMIFPVLMIGMVWIYSKKSSIAHLLIGSFIVSSAVLWNFDSGMVCLVAWILLIIFHHLFADRIKATKLGLRILSIILTFAIVILNYSLIIKLIYGSYPDFLLAFDSQEKFVKQGYFMMPMPKTGLWVVAVFIYLYTGAKISLHIIKNTVSNYISVLFFLMIQGIGLLSYYIGRSHEHVFLAVIYNSVILFIFLYAFSIENEETEKTWLLKFKNGLFGFVFVISIVQICLFGFNYYQWRLLIRESLEPSQFNKRSNYLSSLDPEIKKDGILIISNWAGALHVNASIKIPDQWIFPSFEEVSTNKMLEQEIKILEQCKVRYVYIDKESREFLSKTLEKHYRSIGYSPEGLLLQSDCNSNENDTILEIQKVEDGYVDVLHSSKRIKPGLSITGVTLPQNFIVTFEVTLGEKQEPYAYIAGNHPGWKNNPAGFGVQQNLHKTNHFLFGFGDGVQWTKEREFYLSPNIRHNVKIIVNESLITIIVDGKKVLQDTRDRKLLNTILPLTIGGYIEGGRTLNGIVHFFKIQKLKE